jgi:hypothetical protein
MTRLLPGLLLLGVVATSATAAPDWQLMGRHGECVAIASLSRKLPELGRLAEDPRAFAEQLRRHGLAVTVARIDSGQPDIELWSVDVPARELALLFATAPACAALNRPAD